MSLANVGVEKSTKSVAGSDVFNFFNWRMAQGLIGKHIKNWRLEETNGHGYIGVCQYATRTIGIDRWYMRWGRAKAVKDIALHEIAHALAGSKAGHGRKWKAMARKLGAIPLAVRPSDNDGSYLTIALGTIVAISIGWGIFKVFFSKKKIKNQIKED